MRVTNPVFNLGELQKVLVAPHSNQEPAAEGSHLTRLPFSTAFQTSRTQPAKGPPWRTWVVSPLLKCSVSPFIKREEYVGRWRTKRHGPNSEASRLYYSVFPGAQILSQFGDRRETGFITAWIQNSRFEVTVIPVYVQTFSPAQQKHIVISLNSLSWNRRKISRF